MERNGVSSPAWAPPSSQQQVIPPSVCFRKTGKPTRWRHGWNTYPREVGLYLAQPIAEGDLVVPNPDIGHVVIYVAKPDLWERGLGSQWSGRTQHL